MPATGQGDAAEKLAAALKKYIFVAALHTNTHTHTVNNQNNNSFAPQRKCRVHLNICFACRAWFVVFLCVLFYISVCFFCCARDLAVWPHTASAVIIHFDSFTSMCGFSLDFKYTLYECIQRTYTDRGGWAENGGCGPSNIYIKCRPFAPTRNGDYICGGTALQHCNASHLSVFCKHTHNESDSLMNCGRHGWDFFYCVSHCVRRRRIFVLCSICWCWGWKCVLNIFLNIMWKKHKNKSTKLVITHQPNSHSFGARANSKPVCRILSSVFRLGNHTIYIWPHKYYIYEKWEIAPVLNQANTTLRTRELKTTELYKYPWTYQGSKMFRRLVENPLKARARTLTQWCSKCYYVRFSSVPETHWCAQRQ